MEYLYVLRMYGKDKNLIKLGYTKEIKTKIKLYCQYNTLNEVIYIAKLENAYNIEQYFHSNVNGSSILGYDLYKELAN